MAFQTCWLYDCMLCGSDPVLRSLYLWVTIRLNHSPSSQISSKMHALLTLQRHMFFLNLWCLINIKICCCGQAYIFYEARIRMERRGCTEQQVVRNCFRFLKMQNKKLLTGIWGVYKHHPGYAYDVKALHCEIHWKFSFCLQHRHWLLMLPIKSGLKGGSP